jgi:hypothetical protein
MLGEFGSKDFGDNSNTNADTTVYSDVDKQWLRDTAAYLRGLSESAGSPLSWFFWAWNANSGRRWFCMPVTCSTHASPAHCRGTAAQTTDVYMQR